MALGNLINIVEIERKDSDLDDILNKEGSCLWTNV